VPVRHGMKWFRWVKRSFFLLTLGGIGILEGYYIPRYGVEWLLAAIGATVFLAGFWLRGHWDV
jgi:hypothetical protein